MDPQHFVFFLVCFRDRRRFPDGVSGHRQFGGTLWDNDARWGTGRRGTVFKLTPPPAPGGHWSEAILYSFPITGIYDVTGLTVDAQGNLYGAALYNSNFLNGGIFRLSPPGEAGGSWTETTLYTFVGGPDGSEPNGGLILDSLGNVYGTTSLGGTSYERTVFRLNPPTQPGGQWTESILFSFSSPSTGSSPATGVTLDSSGKLYGTTIGGVAGTHSGTVFELTPPSTPGQPWSETILHNFPVNAQPRGPVAFNSMGDLIGSTYCQGCGTDLECDISCGTVYKLIPPHQAGQPWSEGWNVGLTASSGFSPIGSLLMTKSGIIYGTASSGGSWGSGAVFQIVP